MPSQLLASSFRDHWRPAVDSVLPVSSHCSYISSLTCAHSVSTLVPVSESDPESASVPESGLSWPLGSSVTVSVCAPSVCPSSLYSSDWVVLVPEVWAWRRAVYRSCHRSYTGISYRINIVVHLNNHWIKNIKYFQTVMMKGKYITYRCFKFINSS